MGVVAAKDANNILKPKVNKLRVRLTKRLGRIPTESEIVRICVEEGIEDEDWIYERLKK